VCVPETTINKGIGRLMKLLYCQICRCVVQINKEDRGTACKCGRFAGAYKDGVLEVFDREGVMYDPLREKVWVLELYESSIDAQAEVGTLRGVQYRPGACADSQYTTKPMVSGLGLINPTKYYHDT
jgi:hypothetical protein